MFEGLSEMSRNVAEISGSCLLETSAQRSQANIAGTSLVASSNCLVSTSSHGIIRALVKICWQEMRWWWVISLQ